MHSHPYFLLACIITGALCIALALASVAVVMHINLMRFNRRELAAIRRQAERPRPKEER